jgi:very-short-patch-repair endonuclease
MGGRNKLLNFRHTRTATLEIASPKAVDVLAGLGRGWDFASVDEDGDGGEPVNPGERGRKRPGGLVTQKTTQAGLDSALYRLRQQSRQAFNDYGLWLLWLGVGMLDWKDGDAQEGTSAAPLLLVPVELHRDGQGRTRLQAAEDQEPMHNPALAVRLARAGVDWAAVTEAEADDLAGVLGLFQSHKEAMYQDLLQNEEMILEHPLIRAVALGPDSGLPDDLIGFEPPGLDRIDEVQLPERTPLVLDADASQRQCIAAALDGRSFVMSGPPGTGKSQTITNMIAALMHAGRSVLFVSEKAAALDVVRNRLRGVGLGDFVLALHSGDTTKKAVATELGRVLTTQIRATGAAAHELDRARQLREELSAYAAAMNEVREPLERTLHDVLGRLVLLDQDSTPQLTLRTGSAERMRKLSAGAMQELVTAAGAVSRAWRPAAEGDAFAWQGLVGAAPLAVLAEAADALADLRAAAERRPFAATSPEPTTVHEVGELVRVLRAGLPRREPSAKDALPDDPSMLLAQLADTLGVPKPQTHEEAFSLCALTDLTRAAHRPLTTWFETEALRRAQDAADELRRAIASEGTARAAAEDVFGTQVLQAVDLPGLVERFSTQHKGLMARFSAQFKADREVAAALTHDGAWDKKYAARLGEALAWQQAAAETARLADTHAALLGRYTPRCEDDFGALDEALGVAHRVESLTGGSGRPDRLAPELADGVTSNPLTTLRANAARAAMADWSDIAERRGEQWKQLAGRLLDLFDDARRIRLHPEVMGTLEQARSALSVLQADPHGPEEWQAYSDGLGLLNQYGAGELAQRCAERDVPAGLLPRVVERALLQAWADQVLAADPRLRVTRAADLDSRLADFREADRRLVAAAHGAVVAECNSRRPRSFGGGAAAVINRQAELKTRHMPVRELLSRTREVVHAIKPCFMMSPLTVSQLLPADYQFDVVIFDEASQVRPSDAVNSIYRGRALIVAGDEKQLPPTSFFDASVGDEPDEYDEDAPDTFESLLDACKAGAMRVLPLRWHYRSRHEDLITFSNRSFYKNSMVTFPGARDHGNDVGVAFCKADGVYDRGGRKDNVVEADLVARRVIHHFDTRPGSSLGVVALSQAQASAIEQAVQQARIARPDLDHSFTEDRLDGFFVKNLESVQGDERDVMILSVGYGPDEHGKLGLNFGPINRDGGWRRLNVAVTRARYRMEVVASFHGSQLGESQNESVQHLKRYLDYAENGQAVLAHDIVQDAAAETDSPFEESVLNVLQGWGYDVQPQVGVAGYRIDLGLRHPSAPGSYALGIECDGAMYHSSRVARDRDRLRQQVLEGLGWKLHRIWGTDWYRDRVAAELRLRAAVEQAVAQDPPGDLRPVAAAELSDKGSEGSGGAEASNASDVPVAVDLVRVPVDVHPERSWSVPYKMAEVHISLVAELHTPEARRGIRRALLQIIESEGPLHEDLLVQRTREAWGVAKAGSRIRDNIRRVLTALVREGGVERDGDFVQVAGRAAVQARRPVVGCARKVAHIPSAERKLVLVELAAECPGMSDDELFKQACEFFGWKRLGPDIKAAFDADLNSLLGLGRLGGTRGRISAPSR